MDENELIYSAGISVRNGRSGWWAWCVWQTGEFAKAGFMEGKLGTCYEEKTLAVAIDRVMQLAKRMNVVFVAGVRVQEVPFLYYDDEDEISKEQIKQFSVLLKQEAKRIGFRSIGII